MPNLSRLEGQTNKCRYDTEENGVLQQRHPCSQTVARYTQWLYHFRLSQTRSCERIFFWFFGGVHGVMSDMLFNLTLYRA